MIYTDYDDSHRDSNRKVRALKDSDQRRMDLFFAYDGAQAAVFSATSLLGRLERYPGPDTSRWRAAKTRLNELEREAAEALEAYQNFNPED